MGLKFAYCEKSLVAPGVKSIPDPDTAATPKDSQILPLLELLKVSWDRAPFAERTFDEVTPTVAKVLEG